MTRLLVAGLVAGALCPLAIAAKPPFSPIVVTRDSLALRCSPRDAADVLLRFERALETGNRKALDRVFDTTGFQWYSTDGTAIRDRNRLVPYLLRLHARNVGIRLVGVDVGNSWVPHSVSFGVALLEVGSSSREMFGKGEINCLNRRIYVWSVGAGAAVSPCPGVPTANALRVVLACSRTGRKPLAQEVSRDFRVGPTPLRLPRGCGPAAVRTRVVGALRAFDLAGGPAFARNFTRNAHMQPYTASDPPLNLGGRTAIAAFATRRAAHGDGWTAARLDPPTGRAGLPREAVYGLMLRVTWHGDGVGVKVVIDCRSGLISRWVGPALAEPK